MYRPSRAATAVGCALALAVLAGCESSPSAAAVNDPGSGPAGQVAGEGGAGHVDGASFTGPATIEVGGGSVAVSCSGDPAEDRPVVVLLAGAGDPLERAAPFQQALAATDRVCAYDRPGEGASTPPSTPQDPARAAEVLDAVLDLVSEDAPAVLVGHSLGGLIAAGYAPDHPDRVAGLVLLDATPPSVLTGTPQVIPESATGDAAGLRATVASLTDGQNPERLALAPGPVRSAGDVPVEVVEHGQPYLGALPEYGPQLERLWAQGQREWLGLSSEATLSTAAASGHYIHLEEPQAAVAAVQRVLEQVED